MICEDYRSPSGEGRTIPTAAEIEKFNEILFGNQAITDARRRKTMTNEEAIKVIKDEWCLWRRCDKEKCHSCAYGVAIDAIEKQITIRPLKQDEETERNDMTFVIGAYGNAVVLSLEDYNNLLREIDQLKADVRIAQDQAEDVINTLAHIRETCIIRPRMQHEMDEQ